MTNSDRMARALEREATTSAIEALRAVMIAHDLEFHISNFGRNLDVIKGDNVVASGNSGLTEEDLEL